MIERDGTEWGTPREIGEALGVRATCVRDWIRDKLLKDTAGPDTEVRRRGRFLYVSLAAAARVERATRDRGRPRTTCEPC